MTSLNSLSNKKINVIVFVLSILATLFWLLGNLFDVYHYAIVGVIFEILWLPIIVLTFILPLAALYLFIKDKLNYKSINLYSFLLIFVTVLVMILCL